VPRRREILMRQRIVHRLLAAGAVAAVLAAGPLQAQESPRETGPFQPWLGGLEKRITLVLRLWTGSNKQGHLVDPNGSPDPGAPDCQSCTDQGFLIDPNG
ncbi:MAG TPA: hypothetical protein VLQ45_28860, partial [Thermoanaerobaculia bacterium]|nr:hypothetical protein [Thermoanaerobaculia bacterium]